MSRAGAIAVLVAVVAAIAAGQGRSDGGPAPTGPRYPVIVHRGANLPPPSSAKPVPLVLGFHAVGGSPTDFETTSGLDAVADQHGLVVAYLSAPTPTKPAWTPDQMPQNLPYVIAQIKQLEATQNIDPRRIYATGFSAGATMAFALGCQMSDRLAGIAVVSGAMRLDAPPCKLAHPVSMLLILGSHDAIPIGGNPVLFSADQETAKWRSLDGCTAASNASTTGPVQQTTWSTCDDQAAVSYGVLQNGTHQWPGGPQATGADTQYNAGPELWSFFTAHPGPTSLTTPSATLKKVVVRSSGAKRWLEGVVDVRESRVTAKVSLKPAGGAKRAGSVALARGAAGRVLLRLPAGAPGGRYTATVTLTDSYGRTSTTTRSVVVPKA